MSKLPQSQIDLANHTDLRGFLSSYDVQLKQIGNQFLWPEKNVWIKGYEWFSHYDQTGGYAIRFVMKYFGRSFREAVIELSGDTANIVDPIQTRLILPDRNNNFFRVFMYLRNRRGIDADIINTFITLRTLYEEKQYHNCVFIGRNENGWVSHCHKRSTVSNFKQTVCGSRAEYSFHFNGYSNTIYVFEAPIDMLAYISMNKAGWRKHSYVALCSVSEKALLQQLKAHPNLNHIELCLDNDNAGQTATERIKKALIEKGYSSIGIQNPINKDWDEDLLKYQSTSTLLHKKEVSD